MRTAHRVSYELAHGDGSADGMLVCHHCDNGMCVRPDHLFLGTQKDNMRDMRDKGRARYTGAKNPVRGEAHPCAVLSDEEVRWMRWARDYSGAEYRDIGAKMGVSGTAAHKAIKGKRARWA